MIVPEDIIKAMTELGVEPVSLNVNPSRTNPNILEVKFEGFHILNKPEIGLHDADGAAHTQKPGGADN